MNQENSWWLPEDSAKFMTKAQLIIDQFNGYTVLDTLNVNGHLTLGENIADLGGITIAYEAFKRTKQGKGKLRTTMGNIVNGPITQ